MRSLWYGLIVKIYDQRAQIKDELRRRKLALWWWIDQPGNDGRICLLLPHNRRCLLLSNSLLAKRKNHAPVALRSILIKADLELYLNHNCRVKKATINSGKDWGMSSFETFVSENSINVILSNPDNQYQNGVSERSILFVRDTARCCSI